MSNIPSKYAIADVAYGEGKKHLYCPNESLQFFGTEMAAMDALERQMKDGAKAMVLLKVEKMFKADIRIEHIVDQ